ncbi:unnamed protein product [Chironomus riparius]|uniref:Protein-tyrosine sulfotransferase n=1 Tax=Chironomus riparius TaxID=315576 RepID=A0A9N9WT62_9DIPT|nr:unnamed protein product [Chironomus riparius]
MHGNISIGSSRNNFNRRVTRMFRNRFVDLCLSLCVAVIIFIIYKKCFKSQHYEAGMVREEKFTIGTDNQKYVYHRAMPLIFIGGVPRSGTTLMRAMLDAHPEVRCGQETRVIPRMLSYYNNWLNSEKESMRLNEAGIDKNILANAVAQFCLEIIATHGEPANRLCNKDPLTLKFGVTLSELFPNIKFLFMVRDGRGTVHSIISRKVTVTGFDLDNYRASMSKWNRMIKTMFVQCELLGDDKCMIVHYEKLVLQPKETMNSILDFLNLPWNENVLHHEDFINKSHGIALSKVERSSDQVIKAINLDALSKWVGKIPQDVVDEMAKLAPMLQIMGYDPYANPPNYEAAKMKIDGDLIQNYPGKNRQNRQRRQKDDDDIE